MQMPSSRKVASWRDADTSATPDALKGVREQSARRCDGCFIVQRRKRYGTWMDGEGGEALGGHTREFPRSRRSHHPIEQAR